MDQELISKKELLELTGISYGQLYRWKRKKLIPEDWFIRKSTFTGQETFFPRSKILSRLDRIKGMKDDLSLDELADMFSPNPVSTNLSRQELLQRNIVSHVTLDLDTAAHGSRDLFGFTQVMFLYLVEKLLQTGQMSLDEGTSLLKTLEEFYPRFEGKNCDVLFLRKMGVTTFALLSTQSELYLEKQSKLVARINLASCMEELKIKVT